MRIRLTIHLDETHLAALAAQGPYRHERPLNKNHYTNIIAGLLYADLATITREYLGLRETETGEAARYTSDNSNDKKRRRH
ncbi:MAG TPA: hypothetical protein VJN70_12590 [Gemmatimonadaceae bacterium]|nr:hypothetical protein [Gemmatimonadaceae bacterium]